MVLSMTSFTSEKPGSLGLSSSLKRRRCSCEDGKHPGSGQSRKTYHYHCSVCDYVCISNYTMLRHEMLQHYVVPKDYTGPLHRCPYPNCHYVTNTEQELKTHIEGPVHKNLMSKAIPKSGPLYEDLSEVYEVLSHQIRPVGHNGDLRWLCVICDRAFAAKQSAMEHMKSKNHKYRRKVQGRKQLVKCLAPMFIRKKVPMHSNTKASGFECSLCNVFIQSDKHVLKHIQSDEHLTKSATASSHTDSSYSATINLDSDDDLEIIDSDSPKDAVKDTSSNYSDSHVTQTDSDKDSFIDLDKDETSSSGSYLTDKGPVLSVGATDSDREDSIVIDDDYDDDKTLNSLRSAQAICSASQMNQVANVLGAAAEDLDTIFNWSYREESLKPYILINETKVHFHCNMCSRIIRNECSLANHLKSATHNVCKKNAKGPQRNPLNGLPKFIQLKTLTPPEWVCKLCDKHGGVWSTRYRILQHVQSEQHKNMFRHWYQKTHGSQLDVTVEKDIQPQRQGHSLKEQVNTITCIPEQVSIQVGDPEVQQIRAGGGQGIHVSKKRCIVKPQMASTNVQDTSNESAASPHADAAVSVNMPTKVISRPSDSNGEMRQCKVVLNTVLKDQNKVPTRKEQSSVSQNVVQCSTRCPPQLNSEQDMQILNSITVPSSCTMQEGWQSTSAGNQDERISEKVDEVEMNSASICIDSSDDETSHKILSKSGKDKGTNKESEDPTQFDCVVSHVPEPSSVHTWAAPNNSVSSLWNHSQPGLDGVYKCSLCDISSGNALSFMRHLNSDWHTSNVTEYMKQSATLQSSTQGAPAAKAPTLEAPAHVARTGESKNYLPNPPSDINADPEDRKSQQEPPTKPPRVRSKEEASSDGMQDTPEYLIMPAKDGDKFVCKLCGLAMEFESSWAFHLDSLSHKAKVQSFEEKNGPGHNDNIQVEDIIQDTEKVTQCDGYESKSNNGNCMLRKRKGDIGTIDLTNDQSFLPDQIEDCSIPRTEDEHPTPKQRGRPRKKKKVPTATLR